MCAVSCNSSSNKPTIPSLKETYSKSDKNPFGGYIVHKQLEDMYRRNTIRDKDRPFNETWKNMSDTGSLYFCAAKYLFVGEKDTKAMMDYVYAGNTLFISANYFDDALLDEAKCKESFNEVNPSEFYESMHTTTTSIKDSGYSYYYHPFANYFYGYDSIYTKILGVNENNKPNFILIFHGKGKLFLQCDPKAFSNYFLLKDNNYSYPQNAMAYTSTYPNHLYWDDYYGKLRSRASEKGALDEILSHPPLASAFWLLLALALLFILFGGKRRQRIIKILKPNENTSVTFTETIGRLYLQKKDNKNISEKMITYFNEHVRNSYFLSSTVINDDFITTLSRKSGVQKDKVESLYRAISHAQNNITVDDYQLLSLNEQIQNFYKKK